MNIVHEHEDDLISRLPGRFRISGSIVMPETFAQLRSIADSLDKAQNDSHSVEDLCHIWLTLQQDQ